MKSVKSPVPEIVAGGAVVGWIASKNLAGPWTRIVFGPSGLAGISSGSAAIVGAGCIAAGITVAKALTESSDSVYSERLSDVQRHSSMRAAPGVDLAAAVKELLIAFDWCLAVQERDRGGIDAALSFLSLTSEDNEPLGNAGIVGPRASEEDFRRRKRRILDLCVQPNPARRRKRGGARGGSTWNGPGNKPRQEKEAYNMLFNPQYCSVEDERGALAALCYLTNAFLDLRRAPDGTSDAQRGSLRFAVAALARHPVLDFDVEREEERRFDGAEPLNAEFRRGAQALLCCFDVALSWRPLDPLSWTGTCSEVEATFLVGDHGFTTFAAFASVIRRVLRRVVDGCRVTARRVRVHFDLLCSRKLPSPWPWVWVQAMEASMLVRNRTKVRLRVELHRPPGTKPDPWVDWPLLRAFFGKDPDGPIMVSDMGPGIEWALRPQIEEGRQFQLKLVTEVGVTVCSKQIRRGQTFDFEIKVPAKPHALVLNTAMLDHCNDEDALKDVGEGSTCSTAIPSSCVRKSVDSSVTSAPSWSVSPCRGDRWTRSSSVHTDRNNCGKNGRVNRTKCVNLNIPRRRNLLDAKAGVDISYPLMVGNAPLQSAICPRCLGEMPCRRMRPSAPVYSEGVKCDRCQLELVNPIRTGETRFYHCRQCWYDFCESCALREMHNVWWCD